MKSSLKESIEFSGLSFKKEMVKIFLINLILVLGIGAFYYFVRNVIYTAFGGMFLLRMQEK